MAEVQMLALDIAIDQSPARRSAVSRRDLAFSQRLSSAWARF
jgi:hypothetical protein